MDNDTFKKFDIGVGIGAGFYFTKNIGVTARYVAGFNDVAEDNPTDNSYKNNVFQAGVALKF